VIRWLPYVFVRIVFFFILGIWLAIYFPSAVSLHFAQALFTSLILLYVAIAVTLRLKNSFEDRTTVKFGIGFLGLIIIFIAGFLCLHSNTEIENENHILHKHEPISYYKATITGQLKENEKTFKIESQVASTCAKGNWQMSEGSVLLYFDKRSYRKPFQYGDVLLIKGSPTEISPPSNPDEFDYKRFLSFKSIYHQHYLRNGDVKFIERAPKNFLMYYASKCRSWAEVELNKYIEGERERAIIIALVLGVTDGLDDELLSAYAATGAMHVLAVSGLHIGVIYWLLLFLLKPLDKEIKGKWIIAVICILVLWAYAFITGLSPSVLRAVTMFSFVALARPRGHRTNIYNTLAASAFVLLLYDPYLIMSVGFQLSYLAVLGIVYIHPRLFRLFEPDNKIVRWFWEITSISVAAQLATFALGLLYFHQFPNYFIFSNLVVIPISTGILIGGLALLAFSFAPVVASVIGALIVLSIKLMNYLVFFFEALPFSLVENIYINTTQCWLLIGLIVSFILLFEYKKFKYLTVATIISLVFASVEWMHFFDDVDRTKITVYNIRGHSAIDLIESGHTYFLTDSLLLADKENIRFHIHPNRLRSGIFEVENDFSNIINFNGCNLIRWKTKNIIQIVKPDFELPSSFAIDYLIVSNNSLRDLSLINGHQILEIILDSSNSKYLSDKLLKQSLSNNKTVYSVIQKGAYFAKL
jgi:competence protein ComEC